MTTIYVNNPISWPVQPPVTWKNDNDVIITCKDNTSCYYLSEQSSNPRSININCLYQSHLEQANSKINTEGITVQGNDSNQRFSYINIGELEDEEHVICLKLKGSTELKTVIQQAILVREKITCKTCGKKSNSSNKFCPNCSARLL